MTIEPDTKDWTWVLEHPCPECGFVATDVSVDQLSAAIRETALGWERALAGPGVEARPAPDVWSVLEYACHVRDVHRIFDQRVRLMLNQDDPTFANWDQDETAIADKYDEQDPAIVGPELIAAAVKVADRYESVPDGAWNRRGFRSNGSEFTVESIGRYHLHDIVHHLHDVRAAATRATVAAYDSSAADYRDGTAHLVDAVRALRHSFVAELPRGARVLEIGSGPGRDADALELAGLSVRRTDITPAFVTMMRGLGHDADVIDPLTDDLADPQRPGSPYDGVWASACLLHVARPDLPTVLTKLAGVTRRGGVLHISLKEGDGEQWSTHGDVSSPRLFVYWQEEPLRAALDQAAWSVAEVTYGDGKRGERWLQVRAVRR